MSPIVRNANIILIFLGGIIVTGFFKDETVVTSVPILAMLGAFLGIIVNRTKHLDDLNMTRKKDVSLEYIEKISDYGSVLVSLIESNISMKQFQLNLYEANKNMASSMNKFHVISDDKVSYGLEQVQLKLIKLMSEMVFEAYKEEDKIELMKTYVKGDMFSKLNDIRYEVIELVNFEIGDGSGTEQFKRAIKETNVEYKKFTSEILGVEN